MSIKKECVEFAGLIGPYLMIKDDVGLDRALELVEELMMEAEDSHDDPLNFVLDLLFKAVNDYEDIHYPMDPPDPEDAAQFRQDQER